MREKTAEVVTGVKRIAIFLGSVSSVNGYKYLIWERSGSVVECLTRDRGAAGSSLTCVTVLCP